MKNSNLILNIPHSSTWIPEDCFPKDSEEYRILEADHLNMVDWYTDELFNNGIGVPVIAPVSRMVCDTERFRADEYESMAGIGMGVCYETTSDLRHRIRITKEHKEHVLKNYYDLHHRNLELATDRAEADVGHVFIMDCHSFSPVPLPYEYDQRPDRPDICLGTDYYHTPGQIDKRAAEFFRRRGYRVALNRPYSGTIVPLKYLHKEKIFSMMVEVNRGLYLKPGTNEKNDYFPTLRQHLREFQEYIMDRYAGKKFVFLGSAKANDPIYQYPMIISSVKKASDYLKEGLVQ